MNQFIYNREADAPLPKGVEHDWPTGIEEVKERYNYTFDQFRDSAEMAALQAAISAIPNAIGRYHCRHLIDGDGDIYIQDGYFSPEYVAKDVIAAYLQALNNHKLKGK